jgi:hypothetical protein
MTKGEYKGVKYVLTIGDQWQIFWPSGLKGIMFAASETELKAKLDEL